MECSNNSSNYFFRLTSLWLSAHENTGQSCLQFYHRMATARQRFHNSQQKEICFRYHSVLFSKVTLYIVYTKTKLLGGITVFVKVLKQEHTITNLSREGIRNFFPKCIASRYLATSHNFSTSKILGKLCYFLIYTMNIMLEITDHCTGPPLTFN